MYDITTARYEPTFNIGHCYNYSTSYHMIMRSRPYISFAVVDRSRTQKNRSSVQGIEYRAKEKCTAHGRAHIHLAEKVGQTVLIQ
jgi:hypothetical protein